MSMVIVVVTRPHVLRHSGDDTQHKAETAIQARIAEQAAVTAFVHQCEHPQGEQAHGHYDEGGEPVGDADAQYSQ